MFLQLFRNERPRSAQVLFAILREEGREGAFFQECAAQVVFGRELVDLPFVNIICVPAEGSQKTVQQLELEHKLPGLVFFVCGRHFECEGMVFWV